VQIILRDEFARCAAGEIEAAAGAVVFNEGAFDRHDEQFLNLR